MEQQKNAAAIVSTEKTRGWASDQEQALDVGLHLNLCMDGKACRGR